ncbi:solute carrier family 2, facilitated glucose transporter member 9-like isoform X1 [Pygocentrus nattereri]|uniref:solute carrier family 2, facilitated glucose transporter member 9-like isoform X1 n=1 Tax=Pygocentrus nattereri TaxID=42514 RepID=UPI001890B931|nr:solute carrier family 2, facilitated glucose transporter member 9-like isoform X1 [Pygocentrus nattereri]
MPDRVFKLVWSTRVITPTQSSEWTDMDSVLRQLVRGKALLFIIVLSLGGSFHMGSNVTLISSPAPFIKSFINSSWTERYGEAPGEKTATLIWSTIVSSFPFGGLFGSINVRWITNHLGRKRAMIWNNAISFVALGTMIASRFANSFEMIMLSRFLFGFISGINTSIHCLYLGDSSPKKIRGMVSLTVALFSSSGKLFGQFMGLSEILGREAWWNILLGIPAFFSIIQMVTLPFFPEAPRYLLIEKGNTEECKKALQFLWGPGDYKLEIEEMLVEQAALRGERSKTLLELLRDQNVRWQICSLVIIQGAVEFCGISALSLYSYSIFQEAGIPVDKIRYVTMGVGLSEVLNNITCGLLIDRVGRKVLLWLGFGIMAVIMALMTLTLELKDYSFWIPYSTVALVFLFVIFYGGGPAGVMPSLTHEIFIQSYRSAAFVLMGILLWGSFTVLGFIFPFLLVTLKSFIFLLFSCVCLAASLYIFFILPETKGKTPLEISEEFRKIRVCCSSTDMDLCLETKL